MNNDWVYVGNYKNHTQYYRQSSVIIDEEKSTIIALLKIITNNKNNNSLQSEPNYIKFYQQNKWYLLNYKQWQFTITRITDYSKSGNVSLDSVYQPNWFHNLFPVKWDDIIPDSIVDIFLKKLIQDYDILFDYQTDMYNNDNHIYHAKPSTVTRIMNLLMESITNSYKFNY